MLLSWKNCFRVGVSIFLLYLCLSYRTALMQFLALLVSAASPLLLGCIIAYIVNILMQFYERHFFPRASAQWIKSCRRPLCMIGAFVTLVAIVALVIVLIAPQLTACIRVVLDKLPGFLNSTVAWIDSLGILPEDIMQTLEGIDWRSRLTEIVGILTSGLGDIMGVVVTTVTSIFSGVVTAILSIIFSLYILLGKERLGQQFLQVMERYLPSRIVDKTCYVLRIANHSFHSYIVGQCTEAIIIGILCTLGMMLLRLPYASMIGALTAFTALIPIAGAYIGAGIGAFMILTESPMQALIFLVFIVVLQQIEGNIIFPRVVGSSMSLPAIWILAAVTVGGGVMGIPGMLIGVPLTATLYRLLANDVQKGRSSPSC